MMKVYVVTYSHPEDATYEVAVASTIDKAQQLASEDAETMLEWYRDSEQYPDYLWSKPSPSGSQYQIRIFNVQ